MRRLLAGVFFRLSLRLLGCRNQDERMTFCAAWVLAIKAVQENPELKEAALKK